MGKKNKYKQVDDPQSSSSGGPGKSSGEQSALRRQDETNPRAILAKQAQQQPHSSHQAQQQPLSSQQAQQQQRSSQQAQQQQRSSQQAQQQQRSSQQAQQQQRSSQQAQEQQRSSQQAQQQQRSSQQAQQQQRSFQQAQQQQRSSQQSQQQHHCPKQEQLQQRSYQLEQSQCRFDQGQPRTPYPPDRGTFQRQQQQGSQPHGDGQQQSRAYRSGSREQYKQSPSQPLPPMTIFEGDAISSAGIKRGTIGQPGQVSVNYLEVDMNKMPAIAYHYDVTVTPDKPKKFMRPAVEAFRKKFLDKYCFAYDGKKSCYSNERLPIKSRSEEVELSDSNGRSIKLTVEIKETESLEVHLNLLKNYNHGRIFDKPMRELQCLEVVLSSACQEMAVRCGRSFFKRPQVTYELGDGYEAWTGLYQAAILGDKLFLNTDISHKSFPMDMPVVKYLEKYVFDFRSKFDVNSTLNDYQRRTVEGFLKGINIVYEPPASFGSIPRSYKVNSISQSSAKTHMFTLDEGTKISIAAYFASRNYQIKFPNLPCLHVGSTVKAVYLPMELCKIQSGQALNKKDGSKQVQSMIKFAATSTNERKRKIMELLQFFNHNAFPTIQRFGVTIGKNFIVVPTRVLPSPMIEYANSKTIRPYNGSWQMDKLSFLQTKQASAKGHKWAIVYFMQCNVINEFSSLIKRQAEILNVNLEDKPLYEPSASLDKTFEKLHCDKYDLVFVILPIKGPSYADVKQRAELKYGILTQCIKQVTIERRMNPTLVANILLKVNAKLNGTNHKIDAASHIQLANVMYLGADVTHPSPDERHIPSVVGVAASHDRFGACYNMQYRLQKPTLENIENMESIVLEHLRVYKAFQNRFPAHIIYYRDGVADGQFQIVKRNELQGIWNACAKLKIKVDLTCLIVVKRHHTRFFPRGEPDQRNKFNNVVPGTVVDRVIVHPNEMEFFMVSHQSIQGTAKPTRYNVIENTANLDVDLIQKLTYNLCHMFPRCNRVVSYPAPAYLAHLVAFRGRVYIQGSRDQFRDPTAEYKKRLVNPNFMQRNPMYFV